ncbi:hypothetical protein DL764_009174 [Monosporascus ibericus]|uniref:Serine hydrolase domain-containing protein n=1 Tax=Monosporascus ibericus TaxID=155417 RepID=A0A4Q4SVQ8_9PEZI|nr:hypothetical protein DL764_009174 [Monosporascus ibericus]
MQTAAFRYGLADQHTYEFVQGVVPWELPQDPSNQHYAYYDITSPTSFITALDNLEAYVETEGPFDGVIAYSQGAGLVAMLLVRRQYLQPQAERLFRCAILFSPVQVYDPVAYLERGEVRVLDRLVPAMARFSIPVVIISGEADDRKAECQGLQAICDPALLNFFVHEGGHEVPGIGVQNGIAGTIKAARRGITQAELAVVH